MDRDYLIRIGLALAVALLLLPLSAAEITTEAYSAMRQAARERPRRVILNNDGCDVMYFPRHLEVTRENFLSRRTTFLAGTCDTLMYCPVSAGQGNFTLPLPGCDFLTADPPSPDCRNIAALLAERGDDYFAWLLDFCHGHGMELFFSFRFNDVHDQRHTPENPNLFFAPWKDAHRELLFGRDHTQSPPNGFWTAIDFSKEEPRRRQVELVRTVLDKYDVDGIDLDFSRYLRIFPRTARNETATQEECDALTDMMRQIRALLDETGRRRGKALLLSIVLPDSPRFNRNLGYDMETWFREGLVDIWQQHDGGQLHAIAAAAALAHKYHIKYYAFSGAPYPYAKLEKGSLLQRSLAASYAGRSGNAIAGGADGLYLYNVSNPATFRLGTAIPAPQTPRNYFATGFSWEILRGYVFSPSDYEEARQLNAHVQATIAPGDSMTYPVEVNETPTDGDRLTAYLDRTDGPEGALRLALNGTPLQPALRHGRYETFAVPAALLRDGANDFTVTVAPPAAGTEEAVVFQPKTAADFETRFFGRGTDSAVTAEGDMLVVTGHDRTVGLAKRFDGFEYYTTIAFACEARLAKGRAFIRALNGGYAQTIELRPGEIALVGTSFSKSLNTNKLHKYELILHNADVTLRIDGETVYRGTNPVSAFSPEPLCPLTHETRLYCAQTAFLIGIVPDTDGQAAFGHVAATVPAGSVRLLNLMLQRLPNTPPPALEGTWHDATGETAQRELDGRALPFAATAGARVRAAEMRLRPGTRRNIWAVSDGVHVAAWVITSEGAFVWPSTPINILLNDGGADTYLTVLEEDKALLYRNGALLYRSDADMRVSVDHGEIKTHAQYLTVDEFLSEFARNFTAAEQKILRNGGAVVRGLRDPEDRTIATLEALRLLETR